MTHSRASHSLLTTTTTNHTHIVARPRSSAFRASTLHQLVANLTLALSENDGTGAARAGPLARPPGAPFDFFPSGGMLEDAIVVLAGDNGGLVHEAGNNYPLRGQKATLWEGGVRNSALVHAPRLIPAERAGGSFHGLMHVSDWRPTLQGLAGDAAAAVAAGAALDGHDLWGALVANGASPRHEIVINIDENTTASAASRAQAAARRARLVAAVARAVDADDRDAAIAAAAAVAAADAGDEFGGAALRLGRWKLVVGVSNDTWYEVPTNASTGDDDASAAAARPWYACAPGGGTCVELELGATSSATTADAAAAVRVVGSKALVTALYDIESDPEERVDLSAEHPDVLAVLAARLDWWRANGVAPSANLDEDPAAYDAAAVCGAWVPWITDDGDAVEQWPSCPYTTWCENLAADCVERAAANGGSCDGDDELRFFCTRTCGACDDGV